MSHSSSKVLDALRGSKGGARVQPVIVSNQELAALKESEPAFYRQVQRGIHLWERRNERAA